MAETIKRVEVPMPEALYADLTIEARLQERSLAWIVRTAIRQYLDQQRARHEAPSSKE